MPVIKKTKRAVGGFSTGRTMTNLRPHQVLKMPPCTDACPSSNDMRYCLTTVAQTEKAERTYDESFQLAFATLTKTNPLPMVCGQVCPHLCQQQCNRKDKDEAVNISAVEWAVGDYGLKNNIAHKKITEEIRTEKVAVIGSGPSGLSCAYQLARRGYPVTIFESYDKAGGMLRWGIPDYRLRKDLLDKEIQAILNLGVEIKYNTRIGENITLDDLHKDYKAVYAAIGGHIGMKLGVPGEDGVNVFTGADFLRRVNSGEKVNVGKKVIVIGGGNSAIDAAQVSKRLGAEVTLHYRRTVKEMPAIEHEVKAAEEEGVKYDFLSAPVAVLKSGDRATGMKFIRMELGEPDASGRPRPVPMAGSEYEVQADTIIASVSQQPDFKGLEQLKNEKGWISVDDKSMTSLPGVFAGGDVTNQLGLVTEAIGLGRKAAESIDAHLRGTQPETVEKPPIIHSDKMRLDFYNSVPQNKAPSLSVSERVDNFKPVVSLMEQAQVIDESKRCMSCGTCFGCDDLCFSYCQVGAVKRNPVGSQYKYHFELSMCDGCKKCAEECPCGFIDML
ncbi:NAD(P)-binding protein [Chloroflexota bacterium]